MGRVGFVKKSIIKVSLHNCVNCKNLTDFYFTSKHINIKNKISIHQWIYFYLNSKTNCEKLKEDTDIYEGTIMGVVKRSGVWKKWIMLIAVLGIYNKRQLSFEKINIILAGICPTHAHTLNPPTCPERGRINTNEWNCFCITLLVSP